MARFVFLLVVVVLACSVSAIRLGNYNVDLNLASPFALLNADDATYPATFNTFNASLSSLGSITPIVNQIKADAPDVFSFQGTITAYRSGTPQGVSPIPLPPPAAVPVPGGTVVTPTGSPVPNLIPVTNVIYDSNADFKAALSEYTFFQNIDFEILEFREVTRNYKMRIRVYSGMAIRNSVLPFVIGTPVSNFFTNQFVPSVQNSFVTYPTYHYGWQRASIFLDGKRWIVTAVSLYPQEATNIGRLQANEVLALTANDEYSLIVGGFNSDSIAITPNAFNTLLAPTTNYKDVASNSLLPLNAPFGYTNTFPFPSFTSAFDSVIYRTAGAVRTSNYKVVTSWSASSHRPVVVSLLPVLPDSAGAAPVPIPLPVPVIPPPPLPRNSENSSPVELVDIRYSKFSDGVEPPTVPGVFQGEFEVTQPNLPAASSSKEAVYLPGAFVNRARPLTHSVSNDATSIQMSLLLIVIAIVAMLGC